MDPILKPRTILLTGASGFTGLHLTRLAQAGGHRVIPLKANLNDAKTLEEEVLAIKPDWVAHLAGISFVASKDQEAFYRVHALGTGNLLQSIAKLDQKPSKILLASSATIYGNSPNPFSIETQTPTPIDHYAISKVAMEDMAKTFFDRLPIIIARPFNYTGPGQKGNFLIPKLIDHFANKRQVIELGNLNIEREFNDVSMICEAYLGLLQWGIPNETYNVCTGHARSLQHVVDTLIQLTQHVLEIKVNPDYIRASEVYRMCGDPNKLKRIFEEHGILLKIPSLENTLKNMLTQAGNP